MTIHVGGFAGNRNDVVENAAGGPYPAGCRTSLPAARCRESGGENMPNGATSTQPDALPEREIVRRARLLRLHVLRPVRTHLAGAYSSAFHGPGMAFDELRHYQPGDDVRHIDWHASARFGRPFVKRFVEERELRVRVALDVSASMDFGSGSVTKRH